MFRKFIKRKLDKFGRRKRRLRELEQSCGCSFSDIIALVDNEIGNDHSTNELISRYAYLGGANNLGFILHTFPGEDRLRWITKLAPSWAVQREKLLLEWHREHVFGGAEFAPQLIAAGRIRESDIEFVTMEALQKPDFLRLDDVLALYKKAGASTQEFSTLIGDASSKDLQLQGGSKIRDALTHLVSRFGSAEAQQYLHAYFRERSEAMPRHGTELALIEKAMLRAYIRLATPASEHLGFVHGDFKTKNMLLDNAGRLKLIDFQYYTPGVRVWDLAFYLSKNKRGFAVLPAEVIASKHVTEEEKQLLLFFYIVAAMLHVNAENFKGKYKLLIAPALAQLNVRSIT